MFYISTNIICKFCLIVVFINVISVNAITLRHFIKKKQLFLTTRKYQVTKNALKLYRFSSDKQRRLSCRKSCGKWLACANPQFLTNELQISLALSRERFTRRNEAYTHPFITIPLVGLSSIDFVAAIKRAG